MLNKLIGQTLNRYKILSLLGSGGMGMVFKAHDISLQRDVAIKIMHPHIASQPNFQERFLQEARTAARLDHPGIVQVYDFGHRPYLYIVMKFIPGDNLAGMLRNIKEKQKTMILGEAIQIIRLTAQALDYAHHNGVFHRDIKPGNIMIEPVATDGLPYRPVITDLGLAKLAEGGIATSDGTSMGTPAYMSPEQTLGQETDARSDVYSLGVLLFELATGRLPFPAKTLTEAIHYHTKEPPPSPRSIRPDLPQTLETVILKSMVKDPNGRYANAAAFASALTNIVPNTATEVIPSTVTDAVSLMTEYQSSLVEPRGNSILDDFATPPNLKRDQIQVMTAGKTVRNVPMKTDGLTVGREVDNDIVLDDPKVSRHHARIDYDGSEYRVLDLDSSNGTFLANNRLLPGISDVWNPDKGLRVGNTWLRLSCTEGGTKSVVGTRLDYSRVTSSSGQGSVGVFMEDTNLSVQPGQSLDIQLVLINQGDQVDHFNISVAGISAGWAPGLPKLVYLLPGDQQQVNLVIQPPRSSDSRAGRYALTFLVSSKADPSQVVETKANLTVAAYSQFKADLQPQRLRAGQAGRLTVFNQGNIQEVFNIHFTDAAEELGFQPPQIQLRVPEGQSVVSEFQAQTRRPRWIGGEKNYAFSAHVGLSNTEPQVLHADLISRGFLPAWIIPIMLLLCLLISGSAAAVVGPILFPPTPPTVTLTLTPSITPSPTSEAPQLLEWCIYPLDNPPANFLNCPKQVQALEGQALNIRWNVENVNGVVIDPLGNQAPSGEISYSALSVGSKTFTLRAENATQSMTQSIELIVKSPTPTPSSSPTPTPSITPTASLTPTKTPTLTPFKVPITPPIVIFQPTPTPTLDLGPILTTIAPPKKPGFP